MMTWYYAEGDVRRGPVSHDELRVLARLGTIRAETLMWSPETGGGWAAARTYPQLAEFGFAVSPPPPPAPASAMPPSASPPMLGPPDRAWNSGEAPHTTPYTAAGMRSLFTWFWICIGPGLLLILPLFAGVVLSCILLYRYWALIQDGKARTTPGVAVGLNFVPLFHLYWQFVSVNGLAADMTSYMDRNGVPGPRPSAGLALTACIAGCISFATMFVPLLDVVLLIPYLVISILTFKSFNDAAIAVIQHRDQRNAAR